MLSLSHAILQPSKQPASRRSVAVLRVGAWIFRVDGPKLSIRQIFDMIRANVWHATTTLWVATMHALVIWLIAGCVASGIVYLILSTVLRRYWVVAHDTH